MIRTILALWAICLLAACSGGGGTPTSTPTSTPSSPPSSGGTPVVNSATVTFDAGPAELNVGPGAYTAFNEPYVSIKICAPGSTTNCQTIDHIILDTGSVGLRILQPVINQSLLSALPAQTDPSGNAVGECYMYVNSYVFGSVRQADFSIAGEKVANMPFHAIADAGVFSNVPASCSSGGGTNITTVKAFGANGILGIGTTPTDCGPICAAGNTTGAAYYDCPASGCSAIIARAVSTTAPFQQLPNPVAAFATDNNGTVLVLPSVAPAGAVSMTGTIYFGIGTQANNALGSQTVLPVTTSTNRLGAGLLTAIYNGKSLTQSFLDSGSNDYYFIDTSLPACSDTNLSAFYCPTTSMLLSPTLTATNGTMVNAAFTLYNPMTTTAGSSNVAPGLGVNPTLVQPPLQFANSFDFGVPFFFGRSVYTAIEGRSAGGTQGPYIAF
ncbi:DUF3443 domain-containing protein [Sphingomonas oligophenolica]|uniref:DUF3443 family protein n=1 Tax=Sphingomonas oligophenolica TaxID=301154 RepID=A0ABU9XYR3_9SPHN